MIEIKDFSFGYSKNRFLFENLNLVLDSFPLVIVGPNGAGKTTFLKVLSSLHSIYRGSVLIDSFPLSSLSLKERAKLIAYLPQKADFSFPIRGEEYLKITGVKRIDKGKLLFSDEKLLFSPVTQLSGGEQKKLELNRVFLQDSSYLFLDEPFNQLDINTTFKLLDYILNSPKKIILIMHQLELASRYFENFLLLGRDGFFKYGYKKEIFVSEIFSKAFQNCISVVKDPVWNGYYLFPLLDTDFTFGSKDVSSRAQNRISPVKIHLISGGGSGLKIIPYLNNFSDKYNISVKIGILNQFDSDWFLAKQSGFEILAEKPFSPFTPQKVKELRKSLEEADLILIAPQLVGKGNFKNFSSLLNLSDFSKIYLITDANQLEFPVFYQEGLTQEERDDISKLKKIFRKVELKEIEDLILKFISSSDDKG